MLPLEGVAAAAAKPPLEANEANPPVDGAAAPTTGAADPKTPPGLPSTVVCPKVVLADVAAEPHGDDLGTENPVLPNAGVLGAPKEGAPNAGLLMEGADGVPNAGVPKVEAPVGAAVDDVAQGDCLIPRPDGAPNALLEVGAGIEGAPNGFGGLPKVEAAACASGADG